MHLSLIGKKCQFIRIFTEDDLAALCLSRLFVAFKGRHIHNTAVGKTIDHDSNIHFLDRLFFYHNFCHIINDRAALLGIFLLKLF